jgi:DNA adenine methylase
MNTGLHNKSPLRYPGGKTRACNVLDAILNDYFDITAIDTIISPFFGGGSFEFFLQAKYGVCIAANDKFTPLFNFWTSCKNNNILLCENLHSHIDNVKKDDFAEYRNRIMNEVQALEQSVLYFIINRCSFSGATLSGGFSQESSKKRFTKSSINRIKNLNLSKFTICNLDFTDFIQDSNSNLELSSKRLMFLDPPYYLKKSSKLYGKDGDMHETFEHETLCELLKTKTTWIMTYNNCDYIRELYNDCTIIETGWSYGMNISKKSSEIVIIKNKD